MSLDKCRRDPPCSFLHDPSAPCPTPLVKGAPPKNVSREVGKSAGLENLDLEGLRAAAKRLGVSLVVRDREKYNAYMREYRRKKNDDSKE